MGCPTGKISYLSASSVPNFFASKEGFGKHPHYKMQVMYAYHCRRCHNFHATSQNPEEARHNLRLGRKRRDERKKWRKRGRNRHAELELLSFMRDLCFELHEVPWRDGWCTELQSLADAYRLSPEKGARLQALQEAADGVWVDVSSEQEDKELVIPGIQFRKRLHEQKRATV